MKRLPSTISRVRDLLPVAVFFVLWRLVLVGIPSVGHRLFEADATFFGGSPWANFDGVHYAAIARNGYSIYQQAFFPLYPSLMRVFSSFAAISAEQAGLIISHISTFFALLLFYRLMSGDDETSPPSISFQAGYPSVQRIHASEAYPPSLLRSYGWGAPAFHRTDAIGYGRRRPHRKRWGIQAKGHKRAALRSVALLLLFPTSFFLVSVYTEGLFFLLSVATFYAARKSRWFIAGILGSVASMTRFYGIFLVPALLISYLNSNRKRNPGELISICLIPVGLIAYMVYLVHTTGDAFAFIHTLPAFGTGRATAIVWFPQVMWRYIRIFTLVDPVTYVYAIALLEFSVLLLFSLLLIQSVRMRLDPSYIIYSLAIITVPVLTGTLTSLPRYVLSAFPLFFVLASIDNKPVLYATASVFTLALIIYAAAFLQGHFVA